MVDDAKLIEELSEMEPPALRAAIRRLLSERSGLRTRALDQRHALMSGIGPIDRKQNEHDLFVLMTPVVELGLSKRQLRVLKKVGIFYVYEMVQLGSKGLLRQQGISHGTVADLAGVVERIAASRGSAVELDWVLTRRARAVCEMRSLDVNANRPLLIVRILLDSSPIVTRGGRGLISSPWRNRSNLRTQLLRWDIWCPGDLIVRFTDHVQVQHELGISFREWLRVRDYLDVRGVDLQMELMPWQMRQYFLLRARTYSARARRWEKGLFPQLASNDE